MDADTLLMPMEDVVAAGVQPGPTLHIGAHVGEEAEAYDRCGFYPVTWIEANVNLANPLYMNVKRFGGQVIWAVVSDEPKWVTFHIASNGASSSYMELGTHAQHHPDVTYVDEVRLQATTVDILAELDELEQATYVSMDVQGTELDVLKGAENYLHGVQALYLEVNSEYVYEGNALDNEVTGWVGERGFKPVLEKWTAHAWGDRLYVRR